MAEVTAGDGTALAYETWGDEGAPPVVLLHGLGADNRMWAPYAGRLSEDYHVIAPDLRGHGLSGGPEGPEAYSAERFAEDVHDLLGHVGAELAAVVGTGLGGMAALQFATTWPGMVAALALIDTAPAADGPRFGEDWRQWQRQCAAAAELVRRFGPRALGRRRAAEVKDGFLGGGLRARYSRLSHEGYLGAVHALETRPDLTALLRPQLTMPVLVVVGERGPARDVAGVFVDEVARVRLTVVRDAGHGVAAAQPEVVGPILQRFFREIETGTSDGS